MMYQQPAGTSSLQAREGKVSCRPGAMLETPLLCCHSCTTLSTPARAGSIFVRFSPLWVVEHGVLPGVLSSVSHDATVAWKLPPADTISRPRFSQPRVPFPVPCANKMAEGNQACGEEEEEVSFSVRLASSKPCRRSRRGADGFPGEGNAASCSGRFAGSSPGVWFGKKAS